MEFGADAAIAWIKEDSDGADSDEDNYNSDNPNYCRAEATYKIKLYTVLSAHKPKETKKSLPRDGVQNRRKARLGRPSSCGCIAAS